MPRVYVLAPLLAIAVLFAYYAHWSVAAAVRLLPHERSGDRYFARDGDKEARATLARGKIVYVEYGLPLPWATECREVALQRFAIEFRPIAGCVITESIERFATAYNKVMEAAIVNRFGPDVFDTIKREAQALMEARWSRKQANKALEPTPGLVTPRALE